MTPRLIAASVVVLTTIAWNAGAEVRADDIAKATALCDTNPKCSHGKRDAKGGMSFTVNRDAATLRVYCDVGRNCLMHGPKGQRSAVPDITGFVSSR